MGNHEELKMFLKMANDGIKLLSPQLEEENMSCIFLSTENQWGNMMKCTGSFIGDPLDLLDLNTSMIARIYKSNFARNCSVEDFLANTIIPSFLAALSGME